MKITSFKTNLMRNGSRLHLKRPINYIGLLLALTACQTDTVYHSYQPVDEAGWYRNDTLFYTLPTPVTVHSPYRYSIGIRHKDTYAYQDIWLKINEDTLHLHLADSIGKWKGNGLGALKQFTTPIHPTLTEDSTRQFSICHIMTDQPLKDIHDIGLCIEQNP